MATVLWTQKQDVGPAPRFGHAMAYDRGRERVVLFGGQADGAMARDTWEWDGRDWTQVQNAGPAARVGHALAYDDARGRVVLFGGLDAANTRFRDTWAWDGSDWTQLQDVGPSPRSAHAMADDPGRDRVILFGGDPGGALAGDTWEWDGAEWTQVQDVGPSARAGHAMAYEAGRAVVVLVGGRGDDGAPLGDTWSWNGAAWSQEQDIGPPPTDGGALAPIGATLLLFGGALGDGANGLSGESWEWSGSLWTRRQDIGPAPRRGHAMAFDEGRSRPVLFGGLGATDGSRTAAPGDALGDTWEATIGGAMGGPGEPGDGPELVGLAADPPMIVEGEPWRVVITLSDPAPPGTAIQLEIVGLGAAGDYPLTEGATETIVEGGPLMPGDYTIRATLGSTSLTAQLTVTAGTGPLEPAVASISVEPPTVGFGATITVTVTLQSPAPQDLDVPVQWPQRAGVITVPVPAGATSGGTTLDIDPAVDTAGTNAMTVAFGGATASTTFEIV